MAMTLRLTDDEQAALRERAAAEGISLQDAARQAVRASVAAGQHRDPVSAAALLDSVVNNHALIDGNKRLGWLSAAVFLELNGVRAAGIPNNDVDELVMRVAAHRLDVNEIVTLLNPAARQ